MIAGIAHQTARVTHSVPDFVRAFSGWIAALGRAHDILTAQGWGSGALGALVEALLRPFADAADGGLTTSGPEVMLSPPASSSASA